MVLIRSLDRLQRLYPNPVLTIGNFDGVHKGHQALFHLVKERAAAIGGTSMVMTFEPHPLRVLTGRQGPPLITLIDQKLELIVAQGVDVTLCLEFNKEFAATEPEDFIRDIMVDRIGLKEIVIGYDYTFGRQGRGNRAMLLELGARYGYRVHTVGPLPGPDGEVTSSTRIRDMVMAGLVDEVPALLGRFYRITGRVERGRNRGARLLGFPTANLRLVDELIPKMGVYAVRVTHDGQVYSGVANIGYNPTFGDVGLSVEVHCFDFQKSIYDEMIRVDFIARVRDEKKFSGPDELSAQIRRDCEYAREVLLRNKRPAKTLEEA